MGLINWCWEEIQLLYSTKNTDVFKAELMEFVTSCSLRLIEFSINQAYPLKGTFFLKKIHKNQEQTF